MNPLRCLAQFIAFLHSRSWTSKSDLIYQFLHYVLLIGLAIVATFIYLNYFTGYIFPFDERISVLILVTSLLLIFGYLLLFGKRPYLRDEYKNWQVVVGGIIWILLWAYLLPLFWILKE